MIDRVYQTVKMLGNTEVRGNFKPADFDKALYLVILEKFDEYPFELNRALNRQNRGLISNGLANVPDDILEKMQHFSTEATLIYSIDKFVIPADCRDIDTLLYLDKNEIVLSKNTNAFNHIANFKHTAPTTSYPIGLRIGNKIKVLPATIIAVVVKQDCGIVILQITRGNIDVPVDVQYFQSSSSGKRIDYHGRYPNVIHVILWHHDIGIGRNGHFYGECASSR